MVKSSGDTRKFTFVARPNSNVKTQSPRKGGGGIFFDDSEDIEISTIPASRIASPISPEPNENKEQKQQPVNKSPESVLDNILANGGIDRFFNIKEDNLKELNYEKIKPDITKDGDNQKLSYAKEGKNLVDIKRDKDGKVTDFLPSGEYKGSVIITIKAKDAQGNYIEGKGTAIEIKDGKVINMIPSADQIKADKSVNYQIDDKLLEGLQEQVAKNRADPQKSQAQNKSFTQEPKLASNKQDQELITPKQAVNAQGQIKTKEETFVKATVSPGKQRNDNVEIGHRDQVQNSIKEQAADAAKLTPERRIRDEIGDLINLSNRLTWPREGEPDHKEINEQMLKIKEKSDKIAKEWKQKEGLHNESVTLGVETIRRTASTYLKSQSDGTANKISLDNAAEDVREFAWKAIETLNAQEENRVASQQSKAAQGKGDSNNKIKGERQQATDAAKLTPEQQVGVKIESLAELTKSLDFKNPGAYNKTAKKIEEMSKEIIGEYQQIKGATNEVKQEIEKVRDIATEHANKTTPKGLDMANFKTVVSDTFRIFKSWEEERGVPQQENTKQANTRSVKAAPKEQASAATKNNQSNRQNSSNAHKQSDPSSIATEGPRPGPSSAKLENVIPAESKEFVKAKAPSSKPRDVNITIGQRPKEVEAANVAPKEDIKSLTKRLTTFTNNLHQLEDSGGGYHVVMERIAATSSKILDSYEKEAGANFKALDLIKEVKELSTAYTNTASNYIDRPMPYDKAQLSTYLKHSAQQARSYMQKEPGLTQGLPEKSVESFNELMKNLDSRGNNSRTQQKASSPPERTSQEPNKKLTDKLDELVKDFGDGKGKASSQAKRASQVPSEKGMESYDELMKALLDEGKGKASPASERASRANSKSEQASEVHKSQAPSENGRESYDELMKDLDSRGNSRTRQQASPPSERTSQESPKKLMDKLDGLMQDLGDRKSSSPIEQSSQERSAKGSEDLDKLLERLDLDASSSIKPQTSSPSERASQESSRQLMDKLDGLMQDLGDRKSSSPIEQRSQERSAKGSEDLDKLLERLDLDASSSIKPQTSSPKKQNSEAPAVGHTESLDKSFDELMQDFANKANSNTHKKTSEQPSQAVGQPKLEQAVKDPDLQQIEIARSERYSPEVIARGDDIRNNLMKQARMSSSPKESKSIDRSADMSQNQSQQSNNNRPKSPPKSRATYSGKHQDPKGFNIQ